MDFFEAAILGVVQGVAEWIPIGSKGVIILLGEHFFEGVTVAELIRFALYLHLGTFFAALIYFRKDVLGLFQKLIHYRKADKESQRLVVFFMVTTLVSGAVGISLLKAIESLETWLNFTTKGVLVGLGTMLMVTGLVHLRRRGGGTRPTGDLNVIDGIIAGVAQGVAVIPGISRSGLTIASLLFRNINDTLSLKLSFVMSLPVVLAGNILLNTSGFALTPQSFLSLVLAFGVGLATIHSLLKIANKLPFGWFMLFFGFLVITSVFL
jgi:undecaprenyl-diphosphatase